MTVRQLLFDLAIVASELPFLLVLYVTFVVFLPGALIAGGEVSKLRGFCSETGRVPSSAIFTKLRALAPRANVAKSEGA